MLSSYEARVLRSLLAREGPGERGRGGPLAAGDVAQVRPEADPHFGGMLLAVTQADRYGLRGYLLRPHRGGCREAWLRWKPTDLARIGRLHWRELPEFAQRSFCDAPQCPAEMERRARFAAAGR